MAAGFAVGWGPIPKSGGLLEGRVAAGGPRGAAGWPSGRAAAGFWRVRGGAEGGEELRKGLADAGGGEGAAGRPLGPLPGEAHVGDGAAGEAELGGGQEHEPGPAVRLLGVADARDGPVERPLAEAVGVLQVEAVHVRPPDGGEVGLAGAAPPE